MNPNPGVVVMAELHAGPKFKLVTDATWKVHESTTTHLTGGFGGYPNSMKLLPFPIVINIYLIKWKRTLMIDYE